MRANNKGGKYQAQIKKGGIANEHMNNPVRQQRAYI